MDSFIVFCFGQDLQNFLDFFVPESISGHRRAGPMARRDEIDPTQPAWRRKPGANLSNIPSKQPIPVLETALLPLAAGDGFSGFLPESLKNVLSIR
jgi:hypothetical protein